MKLFTLVALLQAVAHSFAPRSLRPLHKHNTATQSCTRRRRRLSATNEDVLEAIKALSARIDSLAADVEQLKSARVDGLEAELERLRTAPPAPMTTAEALRTPPEPRTSARTAPGLNAALSARAALGAVRGQAPATTSPAVWKSSSATGAPDNSSLSHFSAMTRPSWLSRAARNRHRHAIEQASRRWRGGRRDDSERAVKF